MLNSSMLRWLGQALVIIALLTFSHPVHAAPQADTLENREAIAQQIVKIEMTSWDEQLQMAIGAFAMVAAQLKSKEDVDNFVNRVKPNIRRDKLQRASINALTDMYTVEELQHMMRCLNSEEGRSVKKKSFRAQVILGTAFQREIEFALQNRR